MPRIIELVVSPNGTTTVQTKGYQGAACLDASRFLEQALGTVAQERKTTEFYEEAIVPQSEIQQ
jgi:Protein of unknown function (DUF2997)